MDFLITITAKYLYLVIVLIAAIYWLTLPNKQKKRVFIFGALAAATAYALVKLGGAVFYDPRPFVTEHVTPLYPHTPDNGFPSDHTALTATIAVTIYFVSKKLGTGLMILAVLVGVSRVLAHIHNPIDILGSLLFALIGGAVAYYLTPKITARISQDSDVRAETEANE